MGRRKEHPRVPLPVVKRVEETVKRTIVTPAPPRSFQPWGAGAEVGRGERRGGDRQKGKERQRFSERPSERRQTAGRNPSSARSQGREWVGAGAGAGAEAAAA